MVCTKIFHVFGIFLLAASTHGTNDAIEERIEQVSALLTENIMKQMKNPILNHRKSRQFGDGDDSEELPEFSGANLASIIGSNVVRIIASTLTGNLTGILQGSLALPIGVVSESVDNDDSVNNFVNNILDGASAILPQAPVTKPTTKKPKTAPTTAKPQKMRPVILVQQQYPHTENPNDTLPLVEINEDNANLIAGPKPEQNKTESANSTDSGKPASDLPSVSSYLLYLPNDAAENLAAGANKPSNPKEPTVAYVKSNGNTPNGISIHDLFNSLVGANNNATNVGANKQAATTSKSTTPNNSEEDDYSSEEEDEEEEA